MARKTTSLNKLQSAYIIAKTNYELAASAEWEALTPFDAMWDAKTISEQEYENAITDVQNRYQAGRKHDLMIAAEEALLNYTKKQIADFALYRENKDAVDSVYNSKSIAIRRQLIDLALRLR